MRYLPFALLLFSCQDPPKTTINNSPSVIIQSPEDQSEYIEGDEITFEALVSDEDQEVNTIEVQWYSDQDQSLAEGTPEANGTSQVTTSDLTIGKHVISLTAIDNKNASGKDWIQIEIREAED